MTKFVRIAERYFAERGIQAEITKLYGSMELAPLVRLADCIVDLIDTGITLKDNDMEPSDLIMHIISRIVVNKATMTMKNAIIGALWKNVGTAIKPVLHRALVPINTSASCHYKDAGALSRLKRF